VRIFPSLLITTWLLLLPGLVFSSSTVKPQTAGTGIQEGTPPPLRYVVEGTRIVDTVSREPLFFKGIGYSPYLVNETPMLGAPPGNDDRYKEHLGLLQELNVNYLHVFPMHMPPQFFEALDSTELLYGQDVWVCPYEEDFLAEPFLAKTMETVKAVIDHVYTVGRPDRLILFSIGDELQPAAVIRTDSLHPEVRSYHGKHLSVSNRTPSEIAMARLIDMAMDYELTRYGQRHLYCHTSFTHIGPLADRYDIEVPKENVITPDLGDLICLNVYTYARGVRTSPPGSVTGSSYQGYIEELAASSNKPILITQVGLSTSPYEPKPWVPGFGGHKVEDVPAAFSAIWRDIKTSRGSEKICGVAFFELNDEWWKSGEDGADSSRHDLEDPEEWFGIYAIGEANRLIPKGAIPQTVKKLYQSH
jgi:hypothetical protein